MSDFKWLRNCPVPGAPGHLGPPALDPVCGGPSGQVRPGRVGTGRTGSWPARFHLKSLNVTMRCSRSKLSASSTSRSSTDKDPWDNYNLSPRPVSAQYTLLQIIVINLITNFWRLPFTVTSIAVELSSPSYFWNRCLQWSPTVVPTWC